MAEVLSVRLSDTDNPKRDKEFNDALKIGGATATNVIRETADAYVRFVKAHKRLPSFPLLIVEGKADADALREMAEAYARFTEKHGRPPKFPLAIIEASTAETPPQT